ncbi:hypothetical protein HK096_006455 [Nowakowskiella sp. JEL0078]|nr:hypothetical protein HK096_006455 [Nowakowskiella sp. JEL0078]
MVKRGQRLPQASSSRVLRSSSTKPDSSSPQPPAIIPSTSHPTLPCNSRGRLINSAPITQYHISSSSSSSAQNIPFSNSIVLPHFSPTLQVAEPVIPYRRYVSPPSNIPTSPIEEEIIIPPGRRREHTPENENMPLSKRHRNLGLEGVTIIDLIDSPVAIPIASVAASANSAPVMVDLTGDSDDDLEVIAENCGNTRFGERNLTLVERLSRIARVHNMIDFLAAGVPPRPSIEVLSLTKPPNQQQRRNQNPVLPQIPTRIYMPPPRSPSPEHKATINCAICLSTPGVDVQLSSTVCGHVFCENCVKGAVKINKKCPICRKSLAARNSIHRLYLNV